MSYKIVNNKVVKVQRSAFEIARKKAYRRAKPIFVRASNNSCTVVRTTTDLQLATRLIRIDY